MRLKSSITINESSDRIKLIKFFRSFDPYLTLSEAVYRADHLPFTYEKSHADIIDIENQIKNFTKFTVEEKKEDNYCDLTIYNCNINPPQEYIDAMVWYETLSNQEKNHVDQIAIWRSRPAVC